MSVEVNIDVSGSGEFAQALERFNSGMQRQLHERLVEWAEGVKEEASRLAPVRTGYLRSTIYARTHEWKADVGAEASYAANVEFGSRRAQAQPFIGPAVESRLPDFERFLLQALDNAKAEAGL